MFVKRGDAEIIGVIKDEEHNLDDEGTRKAMELAAKQEKTAKELKDNKTVN